jgi:phosphodiesterase/alkaline phosphatase D-like protein
VPEHGQAIYEAGVKAFRDYAPVTYSAADGLYRSFRWGRNLELFLLDERSFRSAKASAGGTCNLPGGTVQDLAPTAPQAVRLGFAALAPALAQPVSQTCLDRIRDPARTMLGQRQFDRFTAAVRASTATFKVILNEVPMHQYYALPYDRWEGYEAERGRLLEFLSSNVKNVVFITTDTHANFAGEIRLRTLEPGGALGTGIFEAITGPVATNTFARQIDATLGTPGVASLVTGLFFKPAPPRGIGFACAAADVYSYLQVRVTSASITLTPKDLNGQPVVEPGGAPCGPFVIAAR